MRGLLCPLCCGSIRSENVVVVVVVVASGESCFVPHHRGYYLLHSPRGTAARAVSEERGLGGVGAIVAALQYAVMNGRE